MRFLFLLSGLSLLIPSHALADVVRLKDGGSLEGEARVEGREVVVRVDGGELRLLLSDVKGVEEGNGPLAELEARRARLPPDGVEPRLALARWARTHRLTAEARGLWQEVLALAPDHAEARSGLGYHLVNGVWLSPDAFRQAQGQVNYLGQWMSAAEAASEERLRAARRSQRAFEDARRIDRARAEARLQAERLAEPAGAAEPGSPLTPWPRLGGLLLHPGPLLGPFRYPRLPGVQRFPFPAPKGSLQIGVRTRGASPGGQVVFGSGLRRSSPQGKGAAYLAR